MLVIEPTRLEILQMESQKEKRMILLQWKDRNSFTGTLSIERDLRDTFEPHGPVLDVGVHVDEPAAWVSMQHASDAYKASHNFGTELLGSVPKLTLVLNSLEAEYVLGTTEHDPNVPMDTLQVPVNEKQWLISPPPSPPVGWKPIPEDPPCINQDLVDALMGMDPRKPADIFVPQKEKQPRISVVLADESEDEEENVAGLNFFSAAPPWGKQSHGAPWQVSSQAQTQAQKTKRPPTKVN
eukprot:m.19886 g.19886  ORF g.19886 m.19886 type:complete len:239 (-) comp6704_c0_seq2:2038-2754(-)